MKNEVLLVMDYINEIVHPDGKLSGKGYADFVARHNTIENVANAIEYARDNDIGVVYVKVGFSEDYREHPSESPLFGKAKQFGALKLNSWATEFHPGLGYREGEEVIVKNRVSPFYNTNLEKFLEKNGITRVYLAGVSTDLVVESAARDAHDRDYKVVIVSDCCAAANDEDHDNALKTMAKIGQIKTLNDLIQ